METCKRNKIENGMKIYVSLPISGHDIKETKEYVEKVKKFLEEKGDEIVTPFDACNEEGKSYSYYMGRSIEALLECDAVFFVPNWQESKGCMAEFELARIYEKKILM